MDILVVTILVAYIGIPTAIWGYFKYSNWKNHEIAIARGKLYKHFRQLGDDVLFLELTAGGYRFSLDVIGRDIDEDNLWQDGAIIITRTYLAMYKTDAQLPILQVPIESLRGYFNLNRGEIPVHLWIHLEDNSLWYILKIQFKQKGWYYEIMMQALQVITSESANRAYLHQAPYVHLGATRAFTARQYIKDDWELEDEIQLFISPLYLVVMLPDGFISYTVAMESIEDVEAIPLLDNSMGILRFTIAGAYHSFALKNHEKWASQLALAASKVQEIPIENNFLEGNKKIGDF